MECNISSDCPLTASGIIQICYTDVKFSDEHNFCDCYNWFGFVGENCDEVGPYIHLHRFTWSLIIFISFLNSILSGRTLLYNILLGSNPIKGIDPVIFAGSCMFLSSVCIFVSYILQIRTLFDPKELYRTQISDGPELITNTPNGIELFLNVFGSCFFYFGILLFIDSWEKVKTGRSALKSLTSVKTESFCMFSKIIPTIAVFVFLVVMLILTVSLRITELFVFFATISILVSIVLIIMSFRFFKFLKNMEVSGDPTVEATIRVVYYFVLGTSFGLILISVFLLMFFLFGPAVLESNDVGVFNYALFFGDITFILLCLLTTYSAWYFNTVTEGVILTDDNKYCVLIFSKWDRMNNKLMPHNNVDSYANSQDPTIMLDTEQIEALSHGKKTAEISKLF